MKRWYGVRLLFDPRFRRLAEYLLLALLVGYYALYSIGQWVTLDPAALQFDFLQYFRGAQAAAHHTNVYADFERLWGTAAWTVAYIYPPFFALLLAPLTPLGLVAAARLWLLGVHAAFFLSLWLVLRIHPELPPSGRRLFLAAAFAFMPVYLTIRFQQVATVWLLLLTATLWAALRRKDPWAGVLLALAASLKVLPVFLVPLFVRLGRLRIAVYASGALLLITASTLLAAPESWHFFTVVLPRIGLGNANWDNGSVDGLVSRTALFFPGAFGPQTRLVAEGIIGAAVLAVLGTTLWQVGHQGSDWQLRLGVATLVAALLIVSSVTWQHHLVTLLLPFAVAMTWVHARQMGWRWRAWLVTSYVLCWLDRRTFPLPADQQVHSGVEAALVLAGTSVKLVGLMALWLLLLTMLRRENRLALRQPAGLAVPDARRPAA